MPEDRRFFIPDKSAPFSTAIIGISFCSPKYRIRRENSPYTVIEYVVEGEGHVEIDGRLHTVSKDQIYICPSGTKHNYFSSAKNPWTKIWMNVYGELPTILFKEYGFTRYIFDGRTLKPIFERLKELIYESNTNEECQDQILLLFIKLLCALSKLNKESAPLGEGAKMKYFLDNNTHTLISNSTLAAQIYRSPDYCVKLFKKEFGRTPYDYQLEQKMSIARKMLRQTDIPIAELAEALGYSDAHYFSGLFKKKCGLCPKDYRKQKRG